MIEFQAVAYTDQEKQRACWRRWYENNKAQKIGWQKQHRRELQAWWEQFKATKQCERCPERHPACLHFHHKDPTEKDVDLSDAIRSCWSVERIMKEVEKCIVLCANCHAKLHYEERQTAKTEGL